MKKSYYSIFSRLSSVVGYFLLTSFALSEPLCCAIANDPTIEGNGKDGRCLDYEVARLPKKILGFISPRSSVSLNTI